MEIVVLDKVLQIDNGVWFLIFSVYLRVVRSLELQLFNYYLQWYSDTSNFLQFTNLHGLVALGNHLYWIYGMERTLWLFLQKCIYQLSESKKCLNTSGSQVKCLVFFKHELRSPCTTSPCVTALCQFSPQLSFAILSHRAVPVPLCLWPQTPVQRFLGN